MDYKRAIVRKPGSSFANGLTTAGLGKPDFDKALRQHEGYCRALERCGLQVTVLPALDGSPDSPFVEDTAIITESCAIITHPGDPSRRGETTSIKEILRTYREIESIEAPGTLDGGDVLRIDSHFYVGLSNRTNAEGARQLSLILSKYGYAVSTIPVHGVLHLKTGVTYLGHNTLITTDEFALLPEFKSMDMISIDSENAYAANCLTVNATTLLPRGFPSVSATFEMIGLAHLEVEMSEFQKMDGGLSCLSLLLD
jgi:dimethylargininase